MARNEKEALERAFDDFQAQHGPEDVSQLFLSHRPELAEGAERNTRRVIRSLQPIISGGFVEQLSGRIVHHVVSLLEAANSSWPDVLSNPTIESLTHYSFLLEELSRALQSHMPIIDREDIDSLGARAREALMYAEAAREEAERSRRQADEIRSRIETLGVTFSLSTSFESRRKSLYWGRVVWLAIAIVLAAFSIWKTFDFAVAVAGIIEKSINGSGAYPPSLVWAYLAIRSMILVPLFVAFAFSFSQYKKERDLEEEYAHKAAVANSLPSYGQMANDPSVRDQIITGATSVIFSSPVHRKSASGDKDISVDAATKLLDSISKIVERGK